MERLRKPMAASASASIGRPASSPQKESGVPCAAQRATICSRKSRKLDAQHVVAAAHQLVLAVGGEEELLEVVAADRDEVGELEEAVGREGEARGLEHGADLELARARCGRAPARARARRGRGARAASNSAASATKGNMIVQRPALGAADQRLHLHAHDARAVEPDADRPPAERRVRLVGALHVGQHLVRADVEGAEDHRLVAGASRGCGRRARRARRASGTVVRIRNCSSVRKRPTPSAPHFGRLGRSAIRPAFM